MYNTPTNVQVEEKLHLGNLILQRQGWNYEKRFKEKSKGKQWSWFKYSVVTWRQNKVVMWSI